MEPRDIGALLRLIPSCRTVATTGDKATRTLTRQTGSPEPPVGGYSEFALDGRTIRHYRMPSSSRAYPKPLDQKAEAYAAMLRETGILA